MVASPPREHRHGLEKDIGALDKLGLHSVRPTHSVLVDRAHHDDIVGNAEFGG